MSDKVAEIQSFMGPESEAAWIVNLWTNYSNQMAGKMDEWDELQKYLFATDTSTTTNHSLGWKNSTTLPKLTQIRDNLHSNYLSAIFPNDKWLTWNAYTEKDAARDKASTIESYMDNKAREGGLRNTISHLLYDYIDFGNCFAMPSFESRHNETEDALIPGFIGPKAVRISPMDIRFNPLASEFEKTFKIIRSNKTLGELKKLALTNPEESFWNEALNRRDRVRHIMGGHSVDDFEKANSFDVDGFGSLTEYYTSDTVEVMEFYGDFHNSETNELETDRMITVIDRSQIIRNIKIPTYDGRAPIRHAGWRKRTHNLWYMGPLDNLVGMQYRLDHIENAKADAWDLAIHTPLKIVGDVESFEWGPGTEIHLDEGGDVGEVVRNMSTIINADTQMQFLMDQMELMAGAPREAMGIRSPGEKTAFEVQTLDNAAGRIFQEKAVSFEVNLLEPLLNDMLEIAHRNFDGADVIRVMDDDIGAIEFRSITKADITSKGILRPVGARHFAQKAQELQNLIGIFNSPIGNMIAPDTSRKAMTKFVEDVVDLRGYDMFRPNVAIMEQQETQALANQAGENNELAQTTETLEEGASGEDIPI